MPPSGGTDARFNSLNRAVPVRRISLRRADGSPLFLEECVRMLDEAAAIHRSPDSVVVDQSVKDSIAQANGQPFDFSFAGRRRFKGIEGEVPVHRVRRMEAAAG